MAVSRSPSMTYTKHRKDSIVLHTRSRFLAKGVCMTHLHTRRKLTTRDSREAMPHLFSLLSVRSKHARKPVKQDFTKAWWSTMQQMFRSNPGSVFTTTTTTRQTFMENPPKFSGGRQMPNNIVDKCQNTEHKLRVPKSVYGGKGTPNMRNHIRLTSDNICGTNREVILDPIKCRKRNQQETKKPP